MKHFVGTTFFETAWTTISHDSEAEMSVSRCDDPFCYKHRVAYDVTMRQIKALIEISRRCRQYIKVSYERKFFARSHIATI